MAEGLNYYANIFDGQNLVIRLTNFQSHQEALEFALHVCEHLPRTRGRKNADIAVYQQFEQGDSLIFSTFAAIGRKATNMAAAG